MRKLDVAKLREYICEEKANRQSGWLGQEADAVAEVFHQYVRAGCDLSMPKRGRAGGRRPAYWWSDDIASIRAECISLRRSAF